MMDNPILDNLSKHLTENHDADWRYEYIDYDGLAFNCYLPTDSPETYLIVDASHYTIRETGKNVPQGLIDEVLNQLVYQFQLESVFVEHEYLKTE